MEESRKIHVDVYEIVARNAGNTTCVGSFDCNADTPVGDVVDRAVEGTGLRLRRVTVVLDRE